MSDKHVKLGGKNMKYIIHEKDTKRVEGKEKVFISGNMQDIQLIQQVVREVLEVRDCKVYMLPPFEQEINEEEHLVSLKEMNLIIVVLSKRFFEETSLAREVELPFAIENQISILPIMVEEGVEEIFNATFGERHILNRKKEDYIEKLQLYFNNLFADNELAKLVEKAFISSTFLSYRKKDSKYVNQLLHLIHQLDGCEDIAIWYDDFLVPGEDYNEEISYNLKKSDFIILLVTPNLLEDKNYVLDIEYPTAVQENKPIIPIELEPIDYDELYKKYPGLPKCVKVNDVIEFENRIKNILNSLNIKKEVDLDEKKYLLGEAYLTGINVEKNIGKGISLITDSANVGYLKAMQRLGYIYKVGIGIEVDNTKAQYWLEKSKEILLEKVKSTNELSDRISLSNTLINICDSYFMQGKMEKAKETLVYLSDICELNMRDGYMGTGANIGVVNLRMGMICNEEGDYDAAYEYYKKAKKYLKTMWEETNTKQAAKHYAVLLAKQGELGLLLYNQKQNIQYFYQAVECYEEGIRCQQWLVDVQKDKYDIQNLITMQFNLANAYKILGDVREGLEEKIKYYNQALEMFYELCQQKDLPTQTYYKFRSEYAAILNVVGLIQEMLGDIQGAKRLFGEAYEIYSELCDNQEEYECYYGMATTSVQLAVVGEVPPNRDLLIQAFNIFNMLSNKYPNDENSKRSRDAVKLRLDVWPQNIDS